MHRKLHIKRHTTQLQFEPRTSSPIHHSTTLPWECFLCEENLMIHFPFGRFISDLSDLSLHTCHTVYTSINIFWGCCKLLRYKRGHQLKGLWGITRTTRFYILQAAHWQRRFSHGRKFALKSWAHADCNTEQSFMPGWLWCSLTLIVCTGKKWNPRQAEIGIWWDAKKRRKRKEGLLSLNILIFVFIWF